MMKVHDHRVYVEPLASALGGGFVSYAPDLKGCISDGATPEEALRNIYDAIQCWLDAAAEEAALQSQTAATPRYA